MNARSARILCARVALLLTAATLPATMFAQSSDVVSTDTSAHNARVTTDDNTLLSTDSRTVLRRGPAVAPAALVHVNRTTPFDPAPRDPGANVGPNLALMGVGAAAVVVGLLIGGGGGNAVAVGGAVVGLIGLYRYMR